MSNHELAGQRFGRLVVVCRGPDRVAVNGERRLRWRCVCDCGNESLVSTSDLRSGNTRSCGCLATELRKKRRTTHGKTKSRLYNIWVSMRQRCDNKNCINYERYGGRGITVMFTCFEDFQHWAGLSGYSDQLTIDRIDNNGPYSRDNCRWASYSQQNANKRNSRIIRHPVTGVCLCAKEWSLVLGGSSHLVQARIVKLGWSPERAITTPVRRKK